MIINKLLIPRINRIDEINVELEDYYSVLREDTTKSIKEVSSLLSEIAVTDDCNVARNITPLGQRQ